MFVDVRWEVHADFPKTVRAFKALRYQRMLDIPEFFPVLGGDSGE